MTSKVYFLTAPGRIKIGHTARPERRLAQLKAADMEPLEVLAVVNGSRNDERRLHDMLEDHRLRGEWFTDNDQVRKVISGFISGEIKFPLGDLDPEPDDIERPQSAVDRVVDEAMGELRFLLDEIENRQSVLANSSDLVWFAKFLTDNVIDPLTAAPSIDHSRELVRGLGRSHRPVAGK